MELTKEQIKKVKHECRMYLVFDENYILHFSKYMWNNYKVHVQVDFKNGEFHKAILK